MSVQIAKELPPRVQFVQFDGNNADEVAQVSPGLSVDAQEDGSLLIKSWFSVSGSVVNVGDYVVLTPSAGTVVYNEADFSARYEVVAQ